MANTIDYKKLNLRYEGAGTIAFDSKELSDGSMYNGGGTVATVNLNGRNVKEKEELQQAIGEKIVRAYNCHDELLEALEKIKRDAQNDYDNAKTQIDRVNAKHFIVIADKAIKKATI